MTMYGHMTDWGWVWMTVFSISWIAIFVTVVYFAIRHAEHDSNHQRPSSAK
jgi:uncharacterized membrane protein